MTMTTLNKRLSALEISRPAAPLYPTEEELEKARRVFEDLLENPPPSDPRAVAYAERTPLLQIAADYTAMLNGAPAPWEYD